MRLIDLHTHSTCSDGTMTPAELVHHASACGLCALALTDHDTVDGIPEAALAAKSLDIELVPGIEFSTEYQKKGIHIVGLDVDCSNPDFIKYVQDYRSKRMDRNRKIIARMASDGIDISFEKMSLTFGDTSWTRANYGRYLLSLGYVQSINEAFEKYLGHGCRYYIPRERPAFHEVIALIHKANGIPILAHPYQYKLEDDQFRRMLSNLKEAGLIGMELYYSTHPPDYIKYLRPLFRKYDLLPSGGSDFHGKNKPDISLGTGMNNLQIPYQILDNLRKRTGGL